MKKEGKQWRNEGRVIFQPGEQKLWGKPEPDCCISAIAGLETVSHSGDLVSVRASVSSEE